MGMNCAACGKELVGQFRRHRKFCDDRKCQKARRTAWRLKHAPPTTDRRKGVVTWRDPRFLKCKRCGGPAMIRRVSVTATALFTWERCGCGGDDE